MVLLIGGPPAVGKTTLAKRLARRHGLRLYSADTRTWLHRDRALAAGHEAAHRWESMLVDQRGAAPIADMLRMSLHTEGKAMVMDDLRALPSSPTVVAEGTTVPAGVVPPDRALWLLPTEEFHERQLAAAGLPHGAAALYRHLRGVIEAEAREHGVPVLVIDGSLRADDVFAAAEDHFRAALRGASVAASTAERKALLRAANEDVVMQVRGYYGRPWANGDPGVVVKSFLCECGDRGCEAEVMLPVADAAAGPVLAVHSGRAT